MKYSLCVSLNYYSRFMNDLKIQIPYEYIKYYYYFQQNNIHTLFEPSTLCKIQFFCPYFFIQSGSPESIKPKPFSWYFFLYFNFFLFFVENTKNLKRILFRLINFSFLLYKLLCFFDLGLYSFFLLLNFCLNFLRQVIFYYRKHVSKKMNL